MAAEVGAHCCSPGVDVLAGFFEVCFEGEIDACFLSGFGALGSVTACKAFVENLTDVVVHASFVVFEEEWPQWMIDVDLEMNSGQ